VTAGRRPSITRHFRARLQGLYHIIIITENMPSQTAYKRRRQDAFKRSGRSMRLSRLDRGRRSSTDQRQLSSVIRSHARANPYQITPSSGRSVTFWRKTQTTIQLNQSNGFNGQGRNINWGFSLGRIVGFIDGVFSFSLQVPSSAEFQAFFDYYKINAVKMQVFFTKNVDTLNNSNSSALPILQICNDFDDIAETMTIATMNERLGVRHIQFDSGMQNGINHYIKPKPTSVIVATDVSTGTLAASNSGVVFGSQWIDVAQSNIVHNGIKVVHDNQGITAANVLGAVTFVFDVEYVFKGYR